MTPENHHLNFKISIFPIFLCECLFSFFTSPGTNHRCLPRTIWRFPVAAAVGSPTSRRQVSLRRYGRWCGRQCPGDHPGALGGKVFVVELREKLMMEVDVIFGIFCLFWKVESSFLLIWMLCNFSLGKVCCGRGIYYISDVVLCFFAHWLLKNSEEGSETKGRSFNCMDLDLGVLLYLEDLQVMFFSKCN